MSNKIEIFDSSLRDGAQGEGISFSIQDKIDIVKTLDDLGIDFIEAGNPASNPKDLEFFNEIKSLKLKHAQLVSFGSTRRKDCSVEEDTSCSALLQTETPVVSIFGKAWDMHVDKILCTTLEENLSMIYDTCKFFKDAGKTVIFDAEHFYDGFKNNKDYALSAISSAVKAGADRIALCDTNGGCFPDDIYNITSEVIKNFPDVKFAAHMHNDGGLAVANSIAAVDAGVMQVQGTLLGFGERSGNANLSSVIPNLQIKKGYVCIDDDKMSTLTSSAMKIADVANISLPHSMPFIGKSAFAHKAGMHADAVIKQSDSIEHINPDIVGNKRRILMSEFTGKAAVMEKVNKLFPDVDKDSQIVSDIISAVKDKELMGYQYESADSSFELLIRKHIQKIEPFFDLVSYRILDELPYDNGHSATATVKVKVNDELKIAASDGDGPVNALDKSLREALAEFYPCLNKVHLTDYKVRVLGPKDATAAVVRVLITSSDGNDIWTTVGVSQDIIEASFIALVDSIEYKLINQ